MDEYSDERRNENGGRIATISIICAVIVTILICIGLLYFFS